MTYNKKQNNMEVDDMKIKSHLNASLDLSGISVSEDLINRTLEAINKQKDEQENVAEKTSSDEIQKKVIPWNRYVRTFAGVAAAAIVVVAGYGLISTGVLNNSKSEKSTDSSVAYDMASQSADTADTTASTEATEDASTEENLTFSATAQDAELNTEATEESEAAVAEDSGTSDDTVAVAEAPQFTMRAETEMQTITSNYGAVTDTPVGSVASTAGGASLKSGEDTTILAFRDIFVSDPEAAKYVTITDDVNNITVTLTRQEDISDFYLIMDQYQFTYGTETSAEENIKVEVTDDTEGTLYTMSIAEHITVTYEGTEVSSQAVYDAVDPEGFTKSLQELIAKFNQ